MSVSTNGIATRGNVYELIGQTPVGSRLATKSWINNLDVSWLSINGTYANNQCVKYSNIAYTPPSDLFITGMLPGTGEPFIDNGLNFGILNLNTDYLLQYGSTEVGVILGLYDTRTMPSVSNFYEIAEYTWKDIFELNEKLINLINPCNMRLIKSTEQNIPFVNLDSYGLALHVVINSKNDEIAGNLFMEYRPDLIDEKVGYGLTGILKYKHEYEGSVTDLAYSLSTYDACNGRSIFNVSVQIKEDGNDTIACDEYFPILDNGYRSLAELLLYDDYSFLHLYNTTDDIFKPHGVIITISDKQTM